MQELLLLIQHIQNVYFVFSVRINCIITESSFIAIVAQQAQFNYHLLIISLLHLNPCIVVLFFLILFDMHETFFP